MPPKRKSIVGQLKPRQTSTVAAPPVETTPSPTKERPSPLDRSGNSRPLRSNSARVPGHYRKLEGLPSPTKAKPAAKKRKVVEEVKEEEEEEEEESSEDEVMMAPEIAVEEVVSKRSTRTAKKQQIHLPSPARSTTSSRAHDTSDSEASDDDLAISNMLVKKAQRTRSTTTQQLATPESTPSKRKRAASPSRPKVSSPLKQSTTPSKRSASTVVPDSDDEEVERTTPRKTPTKPKTTPSKATISTPPMTRTRSTSTTPGSRSSSRIQRLPPNLAEIKNAPKELRNRLVGFHMEDEGYGASMVEKAGSDEEEDEEEEEIVEPEVINKRRQAKGKGRAVEQDEEDQAIEAEPVPEDSSSDPFIDTTTRDVSPAVDYTLPAPPAVSPSRTQQVVSTDYTSSFLHTHLSRSLSVLNGAALPEARLPPAATSPKFDRSKGVMGYPFLEGGYEEWERPLRGCLDEVVTRGMGNAVVLLGPRGVGKSMIIDRTLRVLSFIHGDKHDFVTVKLSGLVHTTDRLALRSIAMQLRQQGFKTGGEDAEDEGDYSSNSATMTTLLRLLEPSSSTNDPSSATSNVSSKPIVLIVDEFDLFALHPRQSFLYCLLDIVQGNRRRGGVGVIGVSSRVDCLSLLEKRVRSRCQSHVLQMMLPSSLTDFISLGKRLMSTDSLLWTLAKGKTAGKWAAEWNEEIERFWNEKKVKEYFEGLWRISGNLPTELRSTLTTFLSRLDHKLAHSTGPIPQVPRLDFADLKVRETSLSRDFTLEHLSTLELTVLISCKHLSASTIDFQNGFNLEMAHDQYTQWIKSLEAKGKRVGKGSISRAAFCTAFDVLRYTELILPLSTTSTVSPPSASYIAPSRSMPFKMHRLVPREQEIKLEVSKRKDIDREVRRWGGVDA